MKFKLLDVKNLVEENVEFGTCDYCSYFGTHFYDVLVFEDMSGEQYEVENGSWSWGDYMTNWDIDNYVMFADFIKDRDYPKPKNDWSGPSFKEIVSQMYSDYCESWSQNE